MPLRKWPEVQEMLRAERRAARRRKRSTGPRAGLPADERRGRAHAGGGGVHGGEGESLARARKSQEASLRHISEPYTVRLDHVAQFRQQYLNDFDNVLNCVMGWRSFESAHTVCIRKERYCRWCSRTWPVGSNVWTWSGSYNGHPTRVYMCVVCYDYMQSKPRRTFEDGLPEDPFWLDDEDVYAKFDIKHALYLTVKGLMTHREMREREREQRLTEGMFLRLSPRT